MQPSHNNTTHAPRYTDCATPKLGQKAASYLQPSSELVLSQLGLVICLHRSHTQPRLNSRLKIPYGKEQIHARRFVERVFRTGITAELLLGEIRCMGRCQGGCALGVMVIVLLWEAVTRIIGCSPMRVTLL